MALHKKNTIRLLLLTLILITIISSFQINNVRSSSTINYSFGETVIHESSNPSFTNITNVINQTHFTGIYNGTFSFTDEVGETGTDISFVDVNEFGVKCEVLSSYDDHTEVLQLRSDGVGWDRIEYNQFDEVYGTIELWIQLKAVTQYGIRLILWDDATDGLIPFQFDTSNWIQYNDGADHNIVQYATYNWYHIRIDYECSVGGYEGLATDTFFIYINGEKFGAYDFTNDVSSIDSFYLDCSPLVENSRFLDSIGFSWDTDYNIGDNIIPYNYPNNTLNIDKWDFGYNENGTTTEISQQEIPFWDKVSDDGVLLISSLGDGRSVYMRPYSTTHNTIEHDFTSIDGIILVHFNFLLQHWYSTGAETHYIDYEIYSYDDTLIARLRITGIATLDLQYYDGSSYITLESNFHSVADTYDFNITLTKGFVFVESSLNNYSFESINPTKAGIGEIEIDVYASGSDSAGTILNLNEIGVYVDGVSLTEDYGVYSIGNFSWDLTRGASIQTNITGECSISISWETFPYSTSIVELSNFSGYQHIYNSYLDDDDDASNVYISFLTKESFTLSYLKIFQIYISKGIDNYFPVIDSSGIDNNASYFYVDSYNRLRYTLISNDNNSEYIEATFNIPDLQTENYSVSFKSNIDGNGYGFFRLNYTDATSTFLPFPTWLSTTNVIMPQTREIATIGVLITDNDNFYNGICYGFLSNVQLIYIRDIRVQITTLNLMMVIVPLIVLLVPTFGISARYGKNTILPVFILMTIICFATTLIPIWVFFVIMLSAGAFLFMKRKRSDD